MYSFFRGLLVCGVFVLALVGCGDEAPSSPPSNPNTITPPTPPVAPPPVVPFSTFISPYKDVTIAANWNIYEIDTNVTGTSQSVVTLPGIPAVTWAFATGECGAESWAGIPADGFAQTNVKAWAQAGRQYIVSTGGAAGSFTCATDAGFEAFIARYASAALAGIDLDIETGQSQTDIANLVARVKNAQDTHADLRFSFTVATLGGNVQQSLSSDGQAVMAAIKAAGLENVYVNLMTMDFGRAVPSNCVIGSNGLCDMGASAAQAVENFHAQYDWPYAYIEATPMIGGNDVQSNVFTLEDAVGLKAYAEKVGLGGIHWWSLDRDTDCPPGVARASCNSYGQGGTLGFSHAFFGF